MGLSDRKKKILSCVVESYIADGEAVGSKTLQAALDFEVSSATIRNEMAALENEGYLIQPHTSAGRIPSCTSPSISLTRLAISAFGSLSCFRPKAMFCSTVIWGNNA